jgi:hypothetical protein
MALAPGSYLALLSSDAEAGIAGRFAGLELRDTILVLRPGPTVGFLFLFRVPLSGTILDQVEKTGTGMLNIDACRVGWNSNIDRKEALPRSMPKSNLSVGTFQTRDRTKECPEDFQSAKGRWPPNVAFIHGEGCQEMGTRRVKRGGGVKKIESGVKKGLVYGQYGELKTPQYGGVLGIESIASWICVSGCPVALLDKQSGQRPSTLTGRADPTQTHSNPGDNHGNSLFGGGNSSVYADSGGASRFFPQFRNESMLLEWVERLTD